MKIVERQNNGIYILEFLGKLTHDNLDQIKPIIIKIVNEDIKRIIINLKYVSDVDDEWIEFLIKMRKTMDNYNRNLVIAECPERLLHKAKEMEILMYFRTFKTEDEAIESFKIGQAVADYPTKSDYQNINSIRF